MHLRKALSLGVAAVCLAAVAVVPAYAQVLTKIGNTQINGTAPNITFDGTTFTLGNGVGNSASFFGSVGQGNNMDVDIAFGPVTQTGFTIDGMNNFNIITSGGSFQITDHLTNAIVLQGTFGAGAIGGTIGGNSGSFNLLTPSVTYGGIGGPGNMFPAGFLTTQGSLQAGFVTPDSFVGTGGGPITGVAPFVGTDTLTFSAQRPAVPEPGAVALFSSIGVCGTVFGLRRMRRRK
jgi:hypothetical protein